MRYIKEGSLEPYWEDDVTMQCLIGWLALWSVVKKRTILEPHNYITAPRRGTLPRARCEVNPAHSTSVKRYRVAAARVPQTHAWHHALRHTFGSLPVYSWSRHCARERNDQEVHAERVSHLQVLRSPLCGRPGDARDEETPISSLYGPYLDVFLNTSQLHAKSSCYHGDHWKFTLIGTQRMGILFLWFSSSQPRRNKCECARKKCRRSRVVLHLLAPLNLACV